MLASTATVPLCESVASHSSLNRLRQAARDTLRLTVRSTMKNLLLSLTVLVLLESILGFAPTAVSKKSVTFQPARLVHAANGRSSAILRMSDEKGESPATEEGVTREQPTGTFYDDEV